MIANSVNYLNSTLALAKCMKNMMDLLLYYIITKINGGCLQPGFQMEAITTVLQEHRPLNNLEYSSGVFSTN